MEEPTPSPRPLISALKLLSLELFHRDRGKLPISLFQKITAVAVQGAQFGLLARVAASLTLEFAKPFIKVIGHGFAALTVGAGCALAAAFGVVHSLKFSLFSV